MDRKNLGFIYIYLLIFSSFISISLFEILLAMGVLSVLYRIVKNKGKYLEGSLKYPILVFSGVSIISTLFYAPKMFLKSIEEGLFQLIYFMKTEPEKRFVKSVIWVFVFIGLVLIPVVFYRYFTEGKTLAIWGSTFEVGQFYAEFSIMAFLLSVFYFSGNRDKKKTALMLLIAMVFIVVLILTHRRSPILGFLIVSYTVMFIMYRHGFLKKVYFWGLNFLVVISMFGGYIYLSKTDHRFRLLNKVILGETSLDWQSLNQISSSRIAIGADALNIIKTDLEKGNWINLLIGHGIRSGYYLPHKYSPADRVKYESIFILSEFIEKGLIGLLAILAIFYYAFKTFLSVRISESFDLLALGLFVPLLIHLIGSIFTFFWDALLPLYLLLFKVGEMYFSKKSFSQS